MAIKKKVSPANRRPMNRRPITAGRAITAGTSITAAARNNILLYFIT